MRNTHSLLKPAGLIKYTGFIIFLTLFLVSSPVFAKKYGLIIGSNYKGNFSMIPPLDLCETDARLMKSTLISQGKFSDVEILLGKMVTAKNIESSIEKLARKVNSEDTVVLYFSGHGTTQRDTSAPGNMRNYVVMYNRPHVPDNKLNDWVSNIKTPKLVWVFDCCYSGGIARKGRKSKGQGNIPVSADAGGTVIENANQKNKEYFENKAIVASSAGNETSIEVRGSINHGIFTYYFTKGFSPSNSDLNRDGSVTVYEAFEWSKKRVIKEAQKYNHKQTPQISGFASGIILAGRDKPKPPNPSPVKPNPVNPNPPQPGPETDDTDSIEDNEETEDIVEPEVVVHEVKGNVVFITTILKHMKAGPKSMDPTKLIDQTSPMDRLKKNRKKKVYKNETRKILVKASDLEYKIKVQWLNEGQLARATGERIKLGSHVYNGKIYQNRVAQISVFGVPTGVHEFQIIADGYPTILRRMAVETSAAKNKEFVLASLSGYGSIQGKVFLKNFEQPLAGQKVWMPTVNQVGVKHTAITKKDGSFWFLNLVPASNYYIKASFLEHLDNDNIKVVSGKPTQIDIVLNRRMRK